MESRSARSNVQGVRHAFRTRLKAKRIITDRQATQPNLPTTTTTINATLVGSTKLRQQTTQLTFRIPGH
jgi:hypothetical protein